QRQISFRDSLGLSTTRLRPSEAREREPALAPTVRLALEAPDDHSVDPRLVLGALHGACESAGVEVREHAPVARIESDGAAGRVTGLLSRARRTAAGSCPPGRSSWRPAPGPARSRACPSTRGCPCAPSRARSCGCAITP